MNAVLIIITVVQLLVALALILIVLFQSGKSQGLSGAIGGIADSYMSRSKAKSMDVAGPGHQVGGRRVCGGPWF